MDCLRFSHPAGPPGRSAPALSTPRYPQKGAGWSYICTDIHNRYMTSNSNAPLSFGGNVIPGGEVIPLFTTFVHPTAAQRVGEVLATTHLSEGKQVKAFEAKLSEELGLVNPAALNSGTSALHL